MRVETNQHRPKTNEQIGREYNLVVEVESKRAKDRPGGRPSTGKPGERFPQVSGEVSGKARDLAAQRFVLSGKSGAAAGAVVEEDPRKCAMLPVLWYAEPADLPSAHSTAA